MLINNYKELNAWQQAFALSNAIYSCTLEHPFSRDAGLCKQIQRAAVSVFSNIAEGFDRGSRKEFIHFLTIAKASASEVESQLIFAFHQKYISPDNFRRIAALVISTIKLIKGLIRHLQDKNVEKKERVRGFTA
jgi:four helix bundle protein